MSDLNSQQLEGFRRRLLDLRAELRELKQTSDEASRTVRLDQTSVGRLSRMDALQGQAMALERGRRRQLELQRIDAALRHLETGDYGYCVRCDEAIAIQRLEFDPATPLCIECASRSEDPGRA